jgi:hypothetical protein
MSELHRLQTLHTKFTALLIVYAISMGYEVGWGEALRKQEQADANASAGIGIKNSLHLLGLAVDLKLFRDGFYLTDSKSYAQLGEYWKSLDPLCCWGGDFKDKDGNPKPDGDHFSITYQGVK